MIHYFYMLLQLLVLILGLLYQCFFAFKLLIQFSYVKNQKLETFLMSCKTCSFFSGNLLVLQKGAKSSRRISKSGVSLIIFRKNFQVFAFLEHSHQKSSLSLYV